jgi:hypothetical protein
LVQYVKIEPASIDRIRHGETRKFTVKIDAPRYLKYGEYNLEANIIGDLVTADGISQLTDKRTLKLIVHESKREDAVAALDDASFAVEEMIKANFAVIKTKRLLRGANELFEEKKYKQAVDAANLVIKKMEDAFTAKKMLDELSIKVAKGLRKGFKLKGTQELIAIAVDAISKEEFSTAIISLKDAQLTNILETKGKINVIRFIVNNWHWLLLGLVVLVILLKIAYKKLLIYLVSYRLGVLKKEQKIILQLKKEMQNKYFFKKSIGEQLFDQGMQQYEKKLAEIWQQSVKLRSKKIGFLSLPKQVEAIKKEMKDVRKDLKKYQEGYFVKETMPRARYFDGVNVYRRTLAELEKEQSVIEAKVEKAKGTQRSKIEVFAGKLDKGIRLFFKRVRKRRFLKFKHKYNKKEVDKK